MQPLNMGDHSMNKPSHIQKSLVNVDDSVLVLIDIQDHFFEQV